MTLALAFRPSRAQRLTAWLPFVSGCERAAFQGKTCGDERLLVGGVCARAFSPGHFVRMSIRLDALPVELGAHVGLFLDGHRRSYKIDKSLAALRCVSRACLDAARRVIKSHPLISKDLSYMRARQIKAFGKIFGNGCQILKYC